MRDQMKLAIITSAVFVATNAHAGGVAELFFSRLSAFYLRPGEFGGCRKRGIDTRRDGFSSIVLSPRLSYGTGFFRNLRNP